MCHKIILALRFLCATFIYMGSAVLTSKPERKMSNQINHKALWDTINEGGEGCRPDFARRAAPVVAKAAAPVSRMLRDARGNYVPEAKVRARLAANIAKLPTITNASAVEMFRAEIAADEALLAA
jgi:hypothetical protein